MKSILSNLRGISLKDSPNDDPVYFGETIYEGIIDKGTIDEANFLANGVKKKRSMH
jgi:hypothetical protein